MTYLIIDIKKNKEYLENQLIQSTQDGASILALNLKNLLKDKTNPQIASIINSYFNKGSYSEIRLEDSSFSIKDSDLIKKSKDLNEGKWQISNLKVDENIGTVELFTSVSGMEFELDAIEDILTKENLANYKKPAVEAENIYIFTSNEQYKNSKDILFSFTATNIDGKKIDTNASLNMNKILVNVIKDDEKLSSIPKWFIEMIPLKLEEKSSNITFDWKTKATVYVSPNLSEIYTKLYEQAKNTTTYLVFIFFAYVLILFIFVEYILKPMKKS
jgi:hypothetical protein